MGNILNSWVTVSFSRSTLLHVCFIVDPILSQMIVLVIIYYPCTLFKWQWRKYLFSFEFRDLTNESNKNLTIQE
jgi:hypothetical protein